MLAADIVELSDEQRRTLSLGHRWSTDALVDLGRATLALQDARAQLELAEARIARCTARVRQTQQQEGKMFQVVASMLELPPGRWTFDPANGTLVRDLLSPEGASDA